VEKLLSVRQSSFLWLIDSRHTRHSHRDQSQAITRRSSKRVRRDLNVSGGRLAKSRADQVINRLRLSRSNSWDHFEHVTYRTAAYRGSDDGDLVVLVNRTALQ